MHRRLRSFTLAMILISPAFRAGAANAPAGKSGYRLVATYPIAGPGGWDYVAADPAHHRVYVSHATQVEVLDSRTGASSGPIEGTPGVHGIAFATALGRGFITCGESAKVVIFDLKSLKKLGEVKTGKDPDSIAYDPATKRVFAYDGGEAAVTVIDAAAGTVAGSIPLGGSPEFSVSDGAGHMFVNLEDKSELLRIDSRKMTVDKRWPLAPCEAPSSMAFDKAKGRLFIGCGNKLLAVVESSTGKVIETLPIGPHVDASSFDPATGMIFTSTYDGKVTVVRQVGGKYAVVDAIATQQASKTMTLDPSTHRLFVPAASFTPPLPADAIRPPKGTSVTPGTFKLLVYGR